MKAKYQIDEEVWFLNIDGLPEQNSETFKTDIETLIRSILYGSLVCSGNIKGIVFRESNVFYELFGTKILRMIKEEYIFYSLKELKNYLLSKLDEICSNIKSMVTIN